MSLSDALVELEKECMARRKPNAVVSESKNIAKIGLGRPNTEFKRRNDCLNLCLGHRKTLIVIGVRWECTPGDLRMKASRRKVAHPETCLGELPVRCRSLRSIQIAFSQGFEMKEQHL